MDFTAFSIGFIDVYWYGISVMISLICALAAAKFVTALYGEKFAPVVDMAVWGIPSALIGARALFVLMSWPSFADDVMAVFALSRGGLSIYGGIAGFIIAAVIYLKLHHVNIWHWLDMMAPGAVLAMALLQLTNFIMQLTIGLPLPVDMPNDHSLAEYVEFGYRPSGFEDYLYFKPVALYQSAAHFIVFIVALILIMLRRRFAFLYDDGTLFLLAALAVLAVRFGFGFMYLSTDNDVWPSYAQWISLIGICAIIIVYIKKRFINKNKGGK